MANPDTDVSLPGDDGRSASASVDAGSVSLDRHHILQAECARLRIEVAKAASISEEQAARAREKEAEVEAVRAEMEAVRKDNERLSHANEHLRQRVDILTVDEPADEISQEVIEDIKVLRTKIENEDVLEHDEVARVIKDIRDCMRRSNQRAAVDRCDLEAENQSLERQRDDWKFEAERLAIEMNEMEERLRLSDAEKTLKQMDEERDEWKSMVEQVAVELNETKRQRDDWKFEAERLTAAMDQLKEHLQQGDIQKMDEEREGWKSMVEQLAVELNESKREREEIAQKIGHKDSEIMDMVNQINEDVNEVVIKKGSSDTNACCHQQDKTCRKGLIEGRLRALGSSGWNLTNANKRLCPQSSASV